MSVDEGPVSTPGVCQAGLAQRKRLRAGAAPPGDHWGTFLRGRSGSHLDRTLREVLSIDSLAARFGVNRTTIIGHLDRRGMERPKIVRKMTDRSLRDATKHYEAGESLKAVAVRFDVDAKTLTREFRRAGVPIRARPGSPPST